MRTSIEAKRGCGYRKAGGLYLVTEPGLSRPCGKLPFVLETCPTCSGGIKFSRGWTWIDPRPFFQGLECSEQHEGLDGPPGGACAHCTLANVRIPERVGLLWIGEKYYKTPADWTIEVQQMGASRRIPHLPNDFVTGQTWVLVAHKKAIASTCDGCGGHGRLDDEEIPAECPDCKGTGTVHQAAIFHAFKPSGVDTSSRVTRATRSSSAGEVGASNRSR